MRRRLSKHDPGRHQLNQDNSVRQKHAILSSYVAPAEHHLYTCQEESALHLRALILSALWKAWKLAFNK
jgi:hypothetical protein